MVPLPSHKISRVSWYSGYCQRHLLFAYRAFTLSGAPSQKLLLCICLPYAVHTPGCTHPGLGSSAFARRYLRNRCFFLFLRLLRCFSSAGALHTAMDSPYDDRGFHGRVSPFGYRRVTGYLLLTAAFRSLSRPSSAQNAKASSLCPFLLNLCLFGFRFVTGLSSLEFS